MAESLRDTFLNLDPLTPDCCEWCGKTTDGVAFCSLSCEAQTRRLESAQGLLVIRELKRWRSKPNHAARNAALSAITPLVDKFLRTDRKRRERAGEARRAAEAEEINRRGQEAADAAEAERIAREDAFEQKTGIAKEEIDHENGRGVNT